MRRRLAAILLTVSIFWKLIEETTGQLIRNLADSRFAVFLRTMFPPEKIEEPAPVMTDKPEGIDQWIEEAAGLYSLDPDLIRAIIEVESGGDPNAVSPKGAQGLMQLMPETSLLLGVENPFDPRENILGGARYLRDMLNEFGSLKLALAAYNAGPSAVRAYGEIPPYPETESYVRLVTKALHDRARTVNPDVTD